MQLPHAFAVTRSVAEVNCIPFSLAYLSATVGVSVLTDGGSRATTELKRARKWPKVRIWPSLIRVHGQKLAGGTADYGFRLLLPKILYPHKIDQNVKIITF